MKLENLNELYYITSMTNIPSIMKMGILSNRNSKKIEHESVAMEEIQERGKGKMVPGGRPLHDYANLYFNARNKALFKISKRSDDAHKKICILRVHKNILSLPDVVVVDCNASSEWARFGPAPDALELIDESLLFARYWTHPEDPIAEMIHGRITCAEVLVPERIAPEYVIGVYVSCEEAQTTCISLNTQLMVEINQYLFFL